MSNPETPLLSAWSTEALEWPILDLQAQDSPIPYPEGDRASQGIQEHSQAPRDYPDLPGLTEPGRSGPIFPEGVETSHELPTLPSTTHDSLESPSIPPTPMDSSGIEGAPQEYPVADTQQKSTPQFSEFPDLTRDLLDLPSYPEEKKDSTGFQGVPTSENFLGKFPDLFKNLVESSSYEDRFSDVNLELPPKTDSPDYKEELPTTTIDEPPVNHESSHPLPDLAENTIETPSPENNPEAIELPEIESSLEPKIGTHPEDQAAEEIEDQAALEVETAPSETATAVKELTKTLEKRQSADEYGGEKPTLSPQAVEAIQAGMWQPPPLPHFPTGQCVAGPSMR